MHARTKHGARGIGTDAVDTERHVTLSVVIPLYNEREMLPLLTTRLHAVLDTLNVSYEIVLVDDGSRDATPSILRDLAASSSTIRAVLLTRNFGKEAALTAGLDYAHGDAVVVMDADLQDPPELIGQMLHAWRNGADMVCMRRRSRAGENWCKRLSAHGFYRLLNAISAVDIPADTGDFRLLSRKAVNALKRLDERNRYMKGLFAWIGLPTQIIVYDRPPRAAGSSKWGWFKLLGLALEGITSFSTTPLRLATVAGIVTVAFGVLFAVWIAAKALIASDPVPGYPSLICMITIMGGAQLLSVGLLGEYLGKTYHETKRRPIYLVDAVVDARQTVTTSGRFTTQLDIAPQDGMLYASTDHIGNINHIENAVDAVNRVNTVNCTNTVDRVNTADADDVLAVLPLTRHG